ncbi:SMC family ATPase [Pseudalkalibacillus sp. SCS-8]|uniref:SMC family ATPase n=1 Tax=Pseudalkalibacillus nanhaiensis TaxID=3115291 RepID=UPI0032DA1BDB
MRPIHLSVMGLHSFRDKQEVDFQTLCKGGVFGIFGPTGSGKSSLLDAVTLALYGKVERAANTIQGIMNHAEDQLNVSFTFELGHATSGKRYEVERTYKRSKNDSVRTSTCRLIEVVNGEHIVLADKERDVTAKVEEILGLTLTDFTRAVVLPQGKFAEFLSLKGADRRQMLQRLFRLEQYGDVLYHRLKVKMDETKMELKEISAEQQGLGEASKQVLNELKKKLADAIHSVQVQHTNLQKKEVQFDHYRQIWKWQEELNEVKGSLEELNKKESDIKTTEEALHTARIAESLLPIAEELDSLNTDQKHWSESCAKLQAETNDAVVKTEETKKTLDSIKKTRAEKEPGLYERLQELKQALELENEKDQVSGQLDHQKNELKKETESLKALQTELDQHRERKKRALVKQSEIKRMLDEKAISLDDRNKLRDAGALKKEIDSISKQKNEMTGEYETVSQTLRAVISEIDKQNKHQWKVKENIAYLRKHTESIYNRVCEHERVIEEAKSSIEGSLHDLKEQQRKTELHALSSQIAAQLKEGEKCPVCGSDDHPELAIPHENEMDYSAIVKEYEELLSSVRSEEVQMGHCKRDLEYLYEALQEYIQKDEFASDEIAAARFEEIQESFHSTESLHNYLKLLQTETKGFKQDLIELKEKKAKYILDYSNSDKQLLEHTTTEKNHERELDRLTIKINEADEQLRHLQEKWNASYHMFPYAELEEQQREMDQREKDVSELSARYDKSVSYLLEMDDTISKAYDHVQSLTLKVAGIKSEISNLEKRETLIQEKLKERCGEESASTLITKVQNEIDELKNKEQTIHQSWEQQTRNLQKLEKELESARSTLRHLGERLEKVQDHWRKKVAETPFESTEEVKDAVNTKQQLELWEEEIKRFNQQKQQHLNDQSRLLKLLNNQEVSEQEWLKVQEELNQAKEAKEKALSEKARLEGEVEDLEKRAAKYEELETERKEKEKLSERLGKLQTVFRGNSFVEFIAEEQLNQVARDASQRLGELTRQRYALEVDSTGGFVIRDDANGGVRRPVTSLSGGETFLTSLALALSLSAQIQLQGEYPLEFFFLDEGFGTLDQSLLDTVISALERLQMQRVSVGVISHVPELRARLPRKLIVEPAKPTGAGSQVSIETL